MNKLRHIIPLVILVLLISLAFPSHNHLKARENTTSMNKASSTTEHTNQITDPHLLNKFNQLQFGIENWMPYLQMDSDPNWVPATLDETGNFTNRGILTGNISFLPNLSSQVTKLSTKGVFGGNFGGNKAIAQTIPTIKGHHYQLSYQGEYSPLLESPQDAQNNAPGSYPAGFRGGISVLNADTINSNNTLVPELGDFDPGFSALQTFSFTGTGNPVTVVVKVLTDKLGTVEVSLTHFAVLDLDQGIEEVRTGIANLFTDDTHTKLRLSVNQSDLDAVQNQIDLDLILDPLTKDYYQKELDKAQGLLDLVDPAIQVEALVDDPQDLHSYTIIGKTFPDALVQFNGPAVLPDPLMPSDDPRTSGLYHVRADEQGNFQMELLKETFFHAGEVLEATSMLHGKTATTSVTVLDITAPDAPILDPIKDQDQAFTGQAEAGSTVAILDADQNEIAQAKVDATGTFSIAIPLESKPLTPYLDYSAVSTDAAGNESLASESQTVQDTTPPEAKPVKQTFHPGEAYPEDPREMLTDIYDNAGIGPENLTITYQTTPDLTQLIPQEITIKLEDKAGNRTLIQVPVEIITQKITASQKPLSPGTGSSRHITKKALPSTGDQEMTLKVALGAFLALIALVSLYIRKKKLQ